MAQPPSSDDQTFAALFERSAGATTARRRFHEGDRIDVTVVALGRDSVFADLGAKEEGYFSRSALCNSEGKLTVDVGAKIAAVVTRVDDSSGQVELSPVYVRRTSGSEDAPPADDVDDVSVAIPRTSAAPLLIEGAHVRGAITGIERYGVFVQITKTQGRGGRGLVPASETGTPRGSDLKKHFTVGQEVEAKILNIAEDGKIRLSFSALKADAERATFESYAKQEQTEEKRSGKPPVRGFGTFGDLLSKKKI